jgi:hypothetical protein
VNEVEVVLFHGTAIEYRKGHLDLLDQVIHAVIQGLVEDKPDRTFVIVFSKKHYGTVEGDISGKGGFCYQQFAFFGLQTNHTGTSLPYLK